MTIRRIKDGSGGNSGAYLVHTNGFDISDIPTTPSDLPTDPNNGDILIETFSNDFGIDVRAIIRWRYNGSTWVKIGDVEYNTIHLMDEISGNLDLDSLPAAPVNHNSNVPTTYVPWDTLHEEYDNGYITWYTDGLTWTMRFARLRGNNATRFYHYTTFDISDIPSVPTATPTQPSVNDSIVEVFDNDTGTERVTIRWTYNGTAWVILGHPEYHQKHFFDIIGSDLDTGSLPTNPVTYTIDLETSHVPGDTLWEEYNNGYIFWYLDSGGSWQLGTAREFVTGGGGGSADGKTTLGVVSSFNMNSVPTSPSSPPGSPATGDVYIETYNNTTGNQRVIIRWTYNGTIWVMNGTPEYNIRTFHAVVGSNINILSLPATPATPGTSSNYITGDTLREEYNNGYIDWVYATSSWTLRHARLVAATDTDVNNKTTLSHQTSFNTSSIPTSPVSPPVSPISGDVHIETYNNTGRNNVAVIRWTYNGSSWVMNGTPEYNLKRHYATVASNLTAGALPSTPATPGSSTGYITGDTLLETYNNGSLEWTYGTSSWTLSASRVNTNNTYVVKSAVNWDENGTPPTTPNSPPSSPLVNDILIQSYDNTTRNNAVTRYWSYNGSSWVALTNGIHRFNMVFTNAPAVSLTYGVAPTASLAATGASYVNGDILWEKYTNGYGLYKFNNGAWAIQTYGLEVGRIQDAADFQATLGAGVDGYYLIYDHDILKFTLSAT